MEELVFVAGGTVVTVAIAFITWKCMKQTKRTEYPQDTVILHQLPRGPYAPSISQYVIKMETFLRMAKIPYMNVHGRQPSKKGKHPWIQYNGEVVADTEFIIKFLKTKFEINMDDEYSEKETAVARAFQKMLEENTFWAVTTDRWYFDKECRGLRLIKVPAIGIYLFRRHVKNTVWYQGMGRHSPEEVYEILNKDLQALSKFIGTNKYLLGDDPCGADAAVFGQLSQIYWHSFGNQCFNYIKKYDNLCDYCERMKERFWPDWDQCITKGGTQTATK